MLWTLIQTLRNYLERFTAFEGRPFVFQLVTMAVIVLCLTLALEGLYKRSIDTKRAISPVAENTYYLTKAK